MKDKIKRFIIDKKELLIFIGVVVFVFTAVITVASLAIDTNESDNGDIINPIPGGDNNDDETNGNQDGDEPVIVDPEKFLLPVSGEYVVVRTFFDYSKTDEELASASIPTSTGFIQSKGVTYAKSDNSTFDVNAIYDGVVVSIDNDDELVGAKITIKHSDSVYSIYSSLANVEVTVGQEVEGGMKLATASTSIEDYSAGVHVHLEVMVDNSYVDPTTVVGQYLETLTNEK
jgi:murein DD-endopeptidase MepM/ murein hydrolase activator NlpD